MTKSRDAVRKVPHVYKILIEHVSSPLLSELRWCLDYPRDQEAAPLATLETDGLQFQGWILTRHNTVVQPFVRCGDQTDYFPCDVKRADVIRKVLGVDPEGHAQLTCGFRFRLRLKRNRAVFGIRINGEDHALALLSIEGSLKVLEGGDGWLFLDNDTNRSVEQFKGEYLLDRRGLAAWLGYLESFAAAAERKGIRHAVLIAPAKEMVLADAYPFAKGSITPPEQVLAVAQPEHRLVYPVEALQQSVERTFRICDTHWTPHGAMLATVEVLERFGLASDEVKAMFARDAYTEREQVGDLGNKVYPPRSAKERLLRGFSYRKVKRYDNELPNFGRVMILANPKALVGARCMIFGSSSSYSMLDYLGRVFAELVFVHTAGNIDMGLLQRERPDYVLAQTNGRFVVRAPVADYDLAAVMAEKVESMSAEQRGQLLANSERCLGEVDDERMMFYHRLLTDALRAV